MRLARALLAWAAATIAVHGFAMAVAMRRMVLAQREGTWP